MKSVLRSTFTTQGELGHLCPSDVQIRAPRGLAVMVTSLSVPRVMVLQAPRHRPTAAIVNIKVFMAAPLVRWLRNGRADGHGNTARLRVSGAQSLPFSYLNDTFSLVRNSSVAAGTGRNGQLGHLCPMPPQMSLPLRGYGTPQRLASPPSAERSVEAS